MKLREAPACCAVVLATLLATAGSARADALPPPEPLECDTGQRAVTDHGGTHCEYQTCQTAADCPAGMPCVARKETSCDPRGEPCSTYEMKRCADAEGAPSGSSLGGRHSGCACGIGGPSPRGGALWPLAAALGYLARRRTACDRR